MQMPSFMGNPDPFIFKEGAMLFPSLGDKFPIDRQIPRAAQFNLAFENQRLQLEEIFYKVFRKEILIWTMEKNWSKEGDYVVALFYSEISEKSLTPIVTGSNEFVSVGSISPEKFKQSEQASDDKTDDLFDEFERMMGDIRSEESDQKEEEKMNEYFVDDFSD